MPRYLQHHASRHGPGTAAPLTHPAPPRSWPCSSRRNFWKCRCAFHSVDLLALLRLLCSLIPRHGPRYDGPCNPTLPYLFINLNGASDTPEPLPGHHDSVGTVSRRRCDVLHLASSDIPAHQSPLKHRTGTHNDKTHLYTTRIRAKAGPSELSNELLGAARSNPLFAIRRWHRALHTCRAWGSCASLCVLSGDSSSFAAAAAGVFVRYGRDLNQARCTCACVCAHVCVGG